MDTFNFSIPTLDRSKSDAENDAWRALERNIEKNTEWKLVKTSIRNDGYNTYFYFYFEKTDE